MAAVAEQGFPVKWQLVDPDVELSDHHSVFPNKKSDENEWK